MINKKILIFGATGQIGRYCIRRLVKNDYKVIAVTRNSHKAVFLKTQAPIGYLEIEEANIFDHERVENLVSKVDVCINLVGILFETGKNTFKKIHSEFPDRLSKICNNYNVNLIHFSALGLKKALDSKYAISKLEGEKKIRENCSRSIIIKPSLVFSVSDSLSTKFMSLLKNLPFFPLYYNGQTKFMPIHASDVADLTSYIISEGLHSKDIEAVGPETISFKRIIEILLKCINKKRILIPLPLPLAKISARFFEILPSPLITLDQLRLLKYDNIKSDSGISNFDIGAPSKIYFEEGVRKYSYNWMDGGKYSLKEKV